MKEEKSTLAQTGFVWFLRMMAFFAMLSGITYWAQLVGIANETLPRFDLLPVHWQVPCVVLAVLFPCASMGLWMLTSWGIVLWGAALMIEIAMYGVWSETYADKPYLVMSHVAALTLLLVFMGAVMIQRYRRRISDY
jgi:Family of unknown function (DUF6163)